jgi:large repetitive protein
MLTARISSQTRRRGIVLVLVLAMLGLLALVGITFATFAQQARINNRNYMLSILQPQADELFDFALQQLISDTNDMRSVIRGHSLARDMFGNDSFGGALLTASPLTGAFSVTGVAAANLGNNTTVANATGGVYNLTTNISTADPNLYGYNFTRWILRLSFNAAPTLPATGVVNQTFEVLLDNTGGATHVFTVGLTSSDAGGPSNPLAVPPLENTTLNNPTTGQQTQLPGAYIAAGTLGANNFALDGRWLRAFNGSGMGALSTTINVNGTNVSVPNSAYANFRYNNSPIIPLNQPALGVPSLNGPRSVGLDEDYDACDLENWFLSIQSADGQVIIPSFHRPANIRIDVNNGINDWTRTNSSNPQNQTQVWAESASRILRPCRADGNDATTFPDLLPDQNTGKINYDVDNDGDGVTDSVWLDLGYPLKRDSSGKFYKPLFAFMVIGLNGKIPLNTAGNLANAAGPTAGGGNTPNFTQVEVPPFGVGNYINGGPGHAVHLGNSVSEVDPTYALQNAFNQVPVTNGTGPGAETYSDPGAAFINPSLGLIPGANGGNVLPNNSQVDNGGVDVRLTQLRSLLAGTRPQTNPSVAGTAAVNGDNDFVFMNGNATIPQPYYMPNGIGEAGVWYYTNPALPMAPPAQGGAVDFPYTDPNMNTYVLRTTQAVPGRWGESGSVAGGFLNPVGGAGAPQYINTLTTNYTNPPRAGYSYDPYDIISGVPRDAADDNLNAFDPYPAGRLGELGDLDLYDGAGALVLPVERMRRWVVPADINGTGSVGTYNGRANPTYHGADSFGRVEFDSYFRPPGSPGVISSNYTGGVVQTPTGAPLGAIVFPGTTAGVEDVFYTSTPSNQSPAMPAALVNPAYIPDLTNNPLHGYESYRLPDQGYAAGTPYSLGPPIQQLVLPFYPPLSGGMPVGGAVPPTGPGNVVLGTNYDPHHVPMAYPTYDYTTNSSNELGYSILDQTHSDGLNEADEQNLYQQNPLVDSPFGPTDLEWLYRSQDIDGTSLTSRLSQLAPISLTNSIDGIRRRKLFALDTWELNNFVWANDNPPVPPFLLGQFPPNPLFPGQFPTNSSFVPGQSASFTSLGANRSTANNNLLVPIPTLAHKDKKINLNFPLPVSNDPNEPVRQKWISDTYNLLKAILPPKATDTPEELAQLSQYVINMVDFRDPDCTMTHWVNPDVVIAGVVSTALTTGTTPVPTVPVSLQYRGWTSPTPTATPLVTTAQLDQWGMEYNPVALNEVLAYSYSYFSQAAGQNSRANRFFCELVNTQDTPELWATTVPLANSPWNPALDLGGYQYLMGDPYSGGCWDLVFLKDEPYSRPDPYRGQIVPYANTYGLLPLNRDSFGAMSGGGAPADVQLLPLGVPSTTPATGIPTPSASSDYFYAIGNLDPDPNGAYDNDPSTTTTWANPASGNTSSSNYTVNTAAPTLFQSLNPAYPNTNPAQPIDPINGSNNLAPPANAPMPIYPGVLPVVSTPPATPANTTPPPVNYSPTLPTYPIPAANVSSAAIIPSTYYWVCLRRPADPFAPVSASNPMVVVDSMRFPYIEATAPQSLAGPGAPGPTFVPNILTVTSTNNGANAAVPAPPVPTGQGSGAGVTVPVAYSAQRFQPFRGGHAVPTAVGSTAVDPRYGYTEQLVVPSFYGLGTMGIYFLATNTTGAGNNQRTTATYYPATQAIYHTIGWANEYEQGSGNTNEPWNYLVFNDRDYTSVAELLLVPGSPPGLFTKQFVEFAPSWANVTNIFNSVVPQSTPLTGLPNLATGTAGTTPTALEPYLSASTPLAMQYGYTGAADLRQPETYPYLIDKFFYTAYGQINTLDTGNLVGGYASDGWFKMLDFFEVPSQMMAAYGPVAAGVNFDWSRQDTKPGLLNLNLIMDEEVFFSLAGGQSINQQNGQYQYSTYSTMTMMYSPNNQVPNDQFTQQLLNFDQLASWGIPFPPINTSTTGIAPGEYVATFNPGTVPIPLVVSSTTGFGSPNTVYPVMSYPYGNNGVLAADPTYNSALLVNSSSNPASGQLPPQYSNALKAAWVQFLTLRHGGSGYIFGYGTGAVGQNVSVSNVNPLIPGYNGAPNAAPLAGLGLPADRPFHSLSYPDIDFTVMRPAALPPGVGGTVLAPIYYTIPNANPLPGAGVGYLNNPATYNYMGLGTYNLLPNATGTGPLWTTFVGDPGVRNFWLFSGWQSNIPNTLQIPGYPATVNYPITPPVAAGLGGSWPVYPPPVPPRRLFQVPDSYVGASNAPMSGLANFDPTQGTLVLPTAATAATTSTPSNAGELGDPTINVLTVFPNPLPNAMGVTNPVPTPAPGALPPFTFTDMNGNLEAEVVNNSVVNLYWPGGSASYLYISTGAGAAPTKVGLPAGASNPYPGNAAANDNRQHPYWRSEQLQRIMNLTTVRTHQYAVWVTIGFFEVLKQGDLGMVAYDPRLAFDILGPELGAANGKNTRYRSFYLVDRLQLTGFNPASPSSFRAAVIYKNRIQ